MESNYANNVLHYFYTGEGYSGGGFINSLIKTVALADVMNQVLLSQVFPEIVSYVRMVMYVEDGADHVRRIARGDY